MHEKLIKVYKETGNISAAGRAEGVSPAIARRKLITLGHIPVNLPKTTIKAIRKAYDSGKCIATIAAEYHKQHYEISAVLRENEAMLDRKLGDRAFLDKSLIPLICEDYHKRMPLKAIKEKYGISPDIFRRALRQGKADKATRQKAYWCKHCNKGPDDTSFWKTRKLECKKCNTQVPGTHPSARKHALKSAFNLTETQYEGILKEQNMKCALCGDPHDRYNRKPAVDHCHETGEIRGILCVACNTGLGFIEKRPWFIAKMKEYLADPPAKYVL